MNAGYYDEARAWRDWLLRAAAGAPSQLQIMYGLAGERRLTEFEVPWLPGYESPRPGAHRQRRARPAAARRLRRGDGRAAPGAPRRPRSRDEDWAFQRALLEHLETIWRQPDEGIWEVRGGAAALHLLEGDGLGRVRSRHPGDRGVRARRPGRSMAALARRRFTTRSARAASIRRWGASCSRTARRSSTPACCCCRPWASCRPTDPRIARHDRGRRAPAVRRRVRAPLRHAHAASTGCRRARARSSPAASGWPTRTSCSAGWTRRVGCSSGCWRSATIVGLLAEEYDTRAGRLVGNFPQAFSHIALVNTAHNLARATKPAEQRRRPEPE